MSPTIHLNGETITLAEGASVDTLVAARGWSDRAVAVAVDDSVVPRSQWQQTVLTEGSRVSVLSPMQGG